MSAQLNFEVSNQTVKRTDDFNVVQLSRNYLRAHFDFLTEEWRGKSVTAIFITEDRAYSALLDDHGECEVPWEALAGNGYINVSVFGGNRVTTDMAAVFIDKTGYQEAENSSEPTPTMFEQLMEYFNTARLAVVDSMNRAETAAQSIEHISGGTFEDWDEEADG